jgi:hypothetical protein
LTLRVSFVGCLPMQRAVTLLSLALGESESSDPAGGSSDPAGGSGSISAAPLG